MSIKEFTSLGLDNDSIISLLLKDYTTAYKEKSFKPKDDAFIFPLSFQSKENEALIASIKKAGKGATYAYYLNFVGSDKEKAKDCLDDHIRFNDYEGAMAELAKLARKEKWCYHNSKDKYIILKIYLQYTFYQVFSQNKLMEYDGADVIYAGTVGLLEGYSLNTIWGYTTDGYWKSKEEYQQYKEAHPGYKSFSDGKVGGGDVRYLSLPDANGSIDHQVGAGEGTKENHGDLVNLGDSNGRYLYGLNLSAQWKGFDFAVMFQGVARRKLLIDTEAIAPLGRTYQMPWTIHRDYWTEDNQDAYWPRLYNYNGDMYNFQPSDKWVQNAAYLRLKNITLGYTIPIQKRYIQKLRVYVSGNDIWEKSDILKVFDPESGNNVGRNYYPFFRTWSFGVNITL